MSTCSAYTGYNLFSKSLDDLPELPKIVISTLNQYSYCIAQEQPEFKEALIHSEVLLPDGIGIVAAARLQSRQKISKISGSTLHLYLLNKMNRESGSCFYLGSSAQTLKLIKERVAKEYPNVRVDTYSPPFKPCFDAEDNAQMVSAVYAFKPNVLFIGMTAPKQEKWAVAHKAQLDTKIIGSIGAVFDFYAGTVSRPGNIYIRFGLEWLGRLVCEPKRMWKRYLFYGPIFVLSVLKVTLTTRYCHRLMVEIRKRIKPA